MKNINMAVSRILDNNIAVRKLLREELINVRALARKLLNEYDLKCSLEAVISAIRRYDNRKEEKDYLPAVYRMLKQARLMSRMKLSSLLLRKSSATREKLPELFSIVDFEGGDTLRIFEVTRYLKIILDERLLSRARRIFREKDLVLAESRLGELSILYDSDITRIPGLFATLSNELAANNISIVDSMICYNEHIIIVSEKDSKQAYDVIFALLHAA